jgi:hypothetical protein
MAWSPEAVFALQRRGKAQIERKCFPLHLEVRCRCRWQVLLWVRKSKGKKHSNVANGLLEAELRDVYAVASRAQSVQTETIITVCVPGTRRRI